MGVASPENRLLHLVILNLGSVVSCAAGFGAAVPSTRENRISACNCQAARRPAELQDCVVLTVAVVRIANIDGVWGALVKSHNRVIGRYHD